MTIEQVWQRNDNWVGTEVEDSFVMINIDTGKYVALNATASRVWDMLGTPKTVQSMLTEVSREYGVDEETCAPSVGRLLEKMLALEIASPR